MYIARSACPGKYLQIYGIAGRMPELQGKAYDLYINAHGQHRYERYAEPGPTTCHGSRPPMEWTESDPQFAHRPEHDVESVFWTMLLTLVRVCPLTFQDEKEWAPDHVAELWSAFYEHEILEKPHAFAGNRSLTFLLDSNMWLDYFPAEMADIAKMMRRIADQVAPEYAFWPTQPPEDHLHEAVQRCRPSQRRYPVGPRSPPAYQGRTPGGEVCINRTTLG